MNGGSNRNEAVLYGSAPADLWRHTLSQIPSIFGRLVYLAGMRNPNTGKYEHHGLALVFGEGEANKALKRSHAKSFQEWLKLNLEGQKADLDLYLSGLFMNKRTLLAAWLESRPYEHVLPHSVKALERRLYLSDLTALIQVLRNEYGVAAPRPDA